MSDKFVTDSRKTKTVIHPTEQMQIFYYPARGSGIFIQQDQKKNLVGLNKVDVIYRRFLEQTQGNRSSAVDTFASQWKVCLTEIDSTKNVKDFFSELMISGASQNHFCWFKLSNELFDEFWKYTVDAAKTHLGQLSSMDDGFLFLAGWIFFNAGTRSPVRLTLMKGLATPWEKRYMLFAQVDLFAFRQDGTFVIVLDQFLNMMLVQNGPQKFIVRGLGVEIGFDPAVQRDSVVMVGQWNENGGCFPEMASTSFPKKISEHLYVPQFYYNSSSDAYDMIDDFPEAQSWGTMRTATVPATIVQ